MIPTASSSKPFEIPKHHERSSTVPGLFRMASKREPVRSRSRRKLLAWDEGASIRRAFRPCTTRAVTTSHRASSRSCVGAEACQRRGPRITMMYSIGCSSGCVHQNPEDCRGLDKRNPLPHIGTGRVLSVHVTLHGRGPVTRATGGAFTMSKNAPSAHGYGGAAVRQDRRTVV